MSHYTIKYDEAEGEVETDLKNTNKFKSSTTISTKGSLSNLGSPDCAKARAVARSKVYKL
jgi:hypothetical protein